MCFDISGQKYCSHSQNNVAELSHTENRLSHLILSHYKQKKHPTDFHSGSPDSLKETLKKSENYVWVCL